MVLKNSAPCTRCSELMKQLNIKYLIYSNEEGSLTKCKVKDYNTNHVSSGNKYIRKNNLEIK